MAGKASFARKLSRGSIKKKIQTIGNMTYIVFYKVTHGGNGKLTKARRKRSPGKHIILDMTAMNSDGPILNSQTGL